MSLVGYLSYNYYQRPKFLNRLALSLDSAGISVDHLIILDGDMVSTRITHKIWKNIYFDCPRIEVSDIMR